MSSRIQLASGRVFDPLDPDPDKITIEDIAFALGNQCRFNGHVKFYSVAEHSVHVSVASAPTDALYGLLHDAPEAFIGDLASPLKHSEFGEPFREIEDRLMSVIAEKFGLAPVTPASVSQADTAMLFREREALLASNPEADELWAEWEDRLKPETSILPDQCTPHFWHPELARTIFLEQFVNITGQRFGW